MPVEFDLQRHLTDMESRIRQDIKVHGDSLLRTQDGVDDLKVAMATQSGRVDRLEEKAGWIGAGITSGVLALVGVVWQTLSRGR